MELASLLSMNSHTVPGACHRSRAGNAGQLRSTVGLGQSAPHFGGMPLPSAKRQLLQCHCCAGLGFDACQNRANSAHMCGHPNGECLHQVAPLLNFPRPRARPVPPPEAGSAQQTDQGVVVAQPRLSGCGSGAAVGGNGWEMCSRLSASPPVMRQKSLATSTSSGGGSAWAASSHCRPRSGWLCSSATTAACMARSGSARRAEPAACSQFSKASAGWPVRSASWASSSKASGATVFLKSDGRFRARPGVLGQTRRHALARCRLVFSPRGGTAPGSGLLHQLARARRNTDCHAASLSV